MSSQILPGLGLTIITHTCTHTQAPHTFFSLLHYLAIWVVVLRPYSSHLSRHGPISSPYGMDVRDTWRVICISNHLTPLGEYRGFTPRVHESHFNLWQWVEYDLNILHSKAILHKSIWYDLYEGCSKGRESEWVRESELESERERRIKSSGLCLAKISFQYLEILQKHIE